MEPFVSVGAGCGSASSGVMYYDLGLNCEKLVEHFVLGKAAIAKSNDEVELNVLGEADL